MSSYLSSLYIVDINPLWDMELKKNFPLWRLLSCPINGWYPITYRSFSTSGGPIYQPLVIVLALSVICLKKTCFLCWYIQGYSLLCLLSKVLCWGLWSIVLKFCVGWLIKMYLHSSTSKHRVRLALFVEHAFLFFPLGLSYFFTKILVSTDMYIYIWIFDSIPQINTDKHVWCYANAIHTVAL